jgi:hypothetical protein
MSAPVVDLGLGKQAPVTVSGVGWDVWWDLLCHLENTTDVARTDLVDGLRHDLRSVICAAARADR